VGTPKAGIPKKTVQGSLTGAGFDVGRTSPDEKKYGEISRK